MCRCRCGRRWVACGPQWPRGSARLPLSDSATAQDGSMGFFKSFAVGLILLATPLIAQAPKPAASSADGTTPLHVAIRANDLAKVQSLLRAGADASSANRYGITPLSLAAENGNAEMTAILLKAGADPKAVLPGGQTLLM